MPTPESWVSLLQESYDAAWFANFGPLYQRFCKQVSETYCAPGHTAVLLSNATVALTAVLVAAGIKGRVVVPSFTFPATLHSVTAAGCTPVLCDANPETWELDPHALQQLLEGGDVNAVVATRVFGFMRDMNPLRRLCEKHSVPFFADAAAAFGHADQAGQLGSFGPQAEIFSLHVTKVFGIGEGGLVVCTEELAEKLHRTVNFGFNPDRSFADGTNAKIDEVRCAIALVMLDRIDDIIERRAEITGRVMDVAKNHPDIVALPTDVGPTPWQACPLRFVAGHRDRAEALLRDVGIGTRAYYAPSLWEGYRGNMADLRQNGDASPTPCADLLSHEMLCLPVYQNLTETQADYLVEMIEQTLGELN